jgi:hypothetical protein
MYLTSKLAQEYWRKKGKWGRSGVAPPALWRAVLERPLQLPIPTYPSGGVPLQLPKFRRALRPGGAPPTPSAPPELEGCGTLLSSCRPSVRLQLISATTRLISILFAYISSSWSHCVQVYNLVSPLTPLGVKVQSKHFGSSISAKMTPTKVVHLNARNKFF